MPSIIKTWPAFMAPRKVLQIFNERKPAFPNYYFTIGRGKPQREITELYFTYRGRILGYFEIDRIECNVGQFPPLRRIDGGESEWQIRRDNWVAICDPPFHRLREKLYHDAFRGWHYFDLDAYRGASESRIAI